MTSSSARDIEDPPLLGQRGTVLILAFLVMLILAVMVTQLFYSSSVDLRVAEHDKRNLQMELLARAGLRKAQVVLLLDLEDDSSSAEDQEGGSGDEGGGGGLPTGGGSGDGTGDGAQESATVDALDEDWATGDIPFELGSDQRLRVKIHIEDEDRKFNLLLLGTREEEYRKEWRERMERAVDLMRDGKPRDFSSSEASDIVQRIEEWMKGERNDTLELTVAPLASKEQRVDGSTFHPPLSLDELQLAGLKDRTLFTGFLEPASRRDEEDRSWVMGVRSIFTVSTNLEMEGGSDDKGGTNDGSGNDQEGENKEEEDKKKEEEEDKKDDEKTDQEEEEAEGVNNGRINVNTAPLCVLKALLPESELPASAWDEYEEFRNEHLKEILEKLKNPFDDDKDKDEEDRRKDDPDEPIYPLESIEDLRRFEAFSEKNTFLQPDTWDKLSSILAVQSNVFTVTVAVGTTDEPHQYFIVRSLFWRRRTGDETKIIPLVHFKLLSPTEIDLQGFDKELAQWAEEF